jgi:assimilatory nitrate reductase catalytic subunit
MHPQDMARRHWRDGDLVRVQSRRGAGAARAASDSVAPTQAFIAMHWGPEYLGGRGGMGVNALTSSATFCPQSQGSPNSSTRPCAWNGRSALAGGGRRLAAGRPGAGPARALDELGGASATPAACPSAASPMPAWACAFARPAQPAARPLLAQIEAAAGPGHPPVLRYADDPQRPAPRAWRLADGGSAAGLPAGRRHRGRGLGAALLQQGGNLPPRFGRALLAASARRRRPWPPRSPQVCACFDVSEARIVAAASHAAGSSSEAPGLRAAAGLRCGTECGSLPAGLKALVQQTPRQRRPVPSARPERAMNTPSPSPCWAPAPATPSC